MVNLKERARSPSESRFERSPLPPTNVCVKNKLIVDVFRIEKILQLVPRISHYQIEPSSKGGSKYERTRKGR